MIQYSPLYKINMIFIQQPLQGLCIVFERQFIISKTLTQLPLQKEIEMPLEYDYNFEQMDEGIQILPILVTNPQSLNSSRMRQSHCVSGEVSSHRKVMMDLENFIQQSKLREDQRIQELKKRQKNIGKQIQRRNNIKQMKRKELQEQQKKKMFSECTFKPKIHSKNGQKRNFNEFLQNQYAFEKKVRQKRQKMKQEQQTRKNQGTYRPKINSSANKRRQSKEDTASSTVFERLYALRDKQNLDDTVELNPNAQKAFHPTINQRSKNMVRGPIDQLLYEDALRRQQKGNQIVMTSSSMGSKMERTINYNNQKYAAQKFIRQYFFTLQDLKIDSSLNAKIEYFMFNQLLKSMGFMTDQEQMEGSKSTSFERSLVHDAYQILQKYQVNARNVCVFLLALLGIYHINPVNFEEGQEPDESKQFNLDEIDGRKIQKHFDLFYRNRLSSEVSRRQEDRSTEQQHSFQPKINKQSVQMAQRHRNYMLEQANRLIEQYPQLEYSIPEDGVISHTDLLVLHKMAKDIEMQQMRQERQDDQLKECTFKPNTIPSSMNNSKISQNPAGYKKCYELYQYHKNIKFKKDSLQASRAQQVDPQCTFKPQINKGRPARSPTAPVSKQTDQTLYRLYKGRQQHEQKKKFLERGQLQPKQRNNSVGTQEERIPSLILDVNLGQRVDRIILYRGDQNRLQQVAEQFSMKHDLDNESSSKLLEMLRTEMQNILSKIDEDEQSQETDN